MDVIRYK